MVQLNEWTGGTMCGATMQMWALQEESWGMHTAHMGEMPLDSWTKRSLPLWGNAGSAFVLLVSRESYLRCQNMGGKIPKRKTNSFSSSAVDPGWRRSGSSAEAWTLLLSRVRLTPDTLQSYHGSSDLQSKEIEKEYSLLFVPSPSHLLSLHLRSGLQGTYVL